MAYGKAEEIIVVRKWKVEKYMEQIYVQTEDLCVGYHKKVLLSDIALKVNKGEILVLIGPNGAGKSTIIKNLIKEMSPIGGNIYIKGRKISDYTSKEYAKTMSVVLTEKIKTEMMTCRDVVAMGRYPYTNYFGRLTKEDEQIVNESLKKVSAIDIADNDFSQISDGQRQRIIRSVWNSVKPAYAFICKYLFWSSKFYLSICTNTHNIVCYLSRKFYFV